LDISCIVLAGGQGLRLGRNKALETIDGKSLIQRVVSSLSFFDSEIIVVTGAERIPLGLAGYSKLRIIADAYPGKSPLVGIYSGLLASDSFYNLVVACDMPFLSRALLAYMARLSAGFDVVLPRLGDRVEPLHAVYSKGCLEAIEGMFGQGSFSVNQLLNLVRVRYLEAEEISRFDPERLSFFNINTEADLRMARDMAKKDRSRV